MSAKEAAGTAAGPDERGGRPAEVIAGARVRAPTRGNRRLEALLERANSDDELRAWWHMAQVTSERLGMSDHSWVHVQIVLNIALRILRLLVKAGIEPAMVADHRMGRRDAEVVVASGALLHDVGMSIHRADHEAYSLFLAERKLHQLLADLYDEAERTVVASEALHTIIGHRRRGEPYTVEAGEDRAVRLEIHMNNSAGIFQVDDLLATKLRGTPLESQVEVVASVEGETEKRLLGEFRLPEG